MEHRTLRRAFVAVAAIAVLTLAPIVSASATPIPAPGPVLVGDKLSLDFGHGAVGVPSAPQIVTLSNEGTSTVTFAPVSTLTNYPFTTTCGATLAPYNTCTYSIVHDATATGFQGGSLTIGSDGGTVTVDVNAVGGLPPSGAGLVVTPLSIDFGSISAGQATNRTFTYYNESSATAVVGLSPSTIAAPFSYTTTCTNQLDPLQTCTFTVTFAPTSGVVSTAVIQPRGTNQPPSTYDVHLAGTGRPAVNAVDASYSTPLATPLVISDPAVGFVGLSSGYVVDSLGVTSAPSSGTVTANNNGTWTYTPTATFTGVVTFQYGVEDYFGDSDTGTMTITVTAAGAGAPGGGPRLAATGSDAKGPGLLAAALLLLGAAALVVTRVRRSA